MPGEVPRRRSLTGQQPRRRLHAVPDRRDRDHRDAACALLAMGRSRRSSSSRRLSQLARTAHLESVLAPDESLRCVVSVTAANSRQRPRLPPALTSTAKHEERSAVLRADQEFPDRSYRPTWTVSLLTCAACRGAAGERASMRRENSACCSATLRRLQNRPNTWRAATVPRSSGAVEPWPSSFRTQTTLEVVLTEPAWRLIQAGQNLFISMSLYRCI